MLGKLAESMTSAALLNDSLLDLPPSAR